MPNTEGPTLSLGLDASAAERGAKSFADAIDRIISAGKRAADAVDELGSETRDLGPGMDRAGDAAGRLRREVDETGSSARRAKTDFDAVGKGAAELGRSFSFAQSMVAGFAAGIGVGAFNALTNAIASIPGQIIEVGDAYVRLDARLAQAVRGLNDAGSAHRDLLDVSQKLGVAFDSTANFFVRIASQSKELGLSYSDLVTITKTLEGAFKLSGASAGETSAAMMQLGQAFASGKLQGDEFRSVAENAPLVLDRMAQALGVTRGELLQMASAGQLTTETVARAIKSMASGVESDLQSMGSTVGEATTRMGNAWKELLAELNRTGGASEAVVGAINSITAVLSSPTTLDAINLYAKSWSLLGEGVKLGAKIIGEGIAALQAYPKALENLVGTRDLAAEKITKTLRGLPTEAGAPPVTSADYGGTPAMRAAQQAELERGMRAAEVPGLMATISKRPLLPKVATARGGSGGGRAVVEPKLAFDAKPFEAEITALNQRADSAMTQTQQRAQDMLASITEAYASAFADQTRIIEMKRDKDLEAINLAALNADEKARARTMVEEAASHQILQTRQRELDQSLGYMEQLEQSYNRQFRLDQTGNRNREIQRAQQLRQLDQQQNLTPEQRGTAREQILSMTQPLSELERAGESMVEFGDRLTGVDAMAQGVIQGISSIGSTASAAFADAIMAGESFDDTLAKLGESLARMMIQMTMQLAMQQMIGAAMRGIGAAIAPQPGADATGPGAVGMSPMYAMARGGVVETNLRHGVYSRPTYFDVRPVRKLAKGDIADTGLPRGVYKEPTLFPLEQEGFHTFARGTGLLGEAGPEAVLPLTRTSGGELGVKSAGGDGVSIPVNVYVTNSSGATVRTESRGNAQGGKDVLLTIADAVEGIIATRMSRSGTQVNRAVSTVGQVAAR